MTILQLHSEPLQDSWLDAYGHLNEAYYLVPFSNTTWKLQDHFGIGVEYFEKTGCALFTLETHLRIDSARLRRKKNLVCTSYDCRRFIMRYRRIYGFAL
jgi:hypothetical protein